MPDSNIVLPGQPIPLPRGPIPQVGAGIYTRDAQMRASVVGVPKMDGSVGLYVLLFLELET
jgi:exosome complex component CSL4